jgi:D-alanyl-D-alanine carboxypeptidase/D-alanyl-D-alanine-endopeptidase (penicillin-binding protein 4)
VRDINKFSNNTAARQLYLALGPGVESAVIATAGTVKTQAGDEGNDVYASMGSDGIASADPATGNATSGNTGGSAGRIRASMAKSEGAMRKWLAARKLDFPELVIENGSGLSRKERISASHMGALLLAAFQSSVMPEFMSSLPIAAVDGTMKTRLNGSATAGQAHIKTGLLEGVKTMAGYVLTKSGKRAVVVFFVNHPKSGAAQLAMDAMLEWVYKE